MPTQPTCFKFCQPASRFAELLDVVLADLEEEVAGGVATTRVHPPRLWKQAYLPIPVRGR